jgi:hypothetical protein
MKFAEITAWVEAHPGESIVIGGGGVIVLLWLLGYFSSTPASSDSGASNMAAAYYAAEANQATVAGQIQALTVQTAGATAVAGIQANAATAINQAQTSAAVTMNGQNTSSALNATYSNNSTAQAISASNNTLAAFQTHSDNLTADWHDVFGTVVPTEIAASGGNASILSSFFSSLPGGFSSIGVVNPNALTSLGWTSDQIKQVMGDVYGSAAQPPNQNASIYATLAGGAK